MHTDSTWMIEGVLRQFSHRVCMQIDPGQVIQMFDASGERCRSGIRQIEPVQIMHVAQVGGPSQMTVVGEIQCGQTPHALEACLALPRQPYVIVAQIERGQTRATLGELRQTREVAVADIQPAQTAKPIQKGKDASERYILDKSRQST